MRQLDVLFVHPNAAGKIYQDLSKDYSAYEPPIWALLLANHCYTKGFSSEILDCEVNRLSHEKAVECVKNYNPRLVVFCIYGQQPSASTQNMQGAVELAELLRNTYPQYPIMFIGNHVSALPYEVLNYSFIDFIAQNEGVYTLSALLGTDLKTDLCKIDGLGWKNYGVPSLNKIGPIVPQEKLEIDLPGMNLNSINLQKYRTANWHVNFSDHSDKYNFLSIYTSLGCYAQCSFCMINILNRTEQGIGVHAAHSNIFRYWNPEFTIRQFELAAAQGVKNVKIADEMFVYKPKHFLRLCELLIERDYGFNIWCYSRINTLKPQYLEKLKAAGVNWVGLGIEAGSQVIRDESTKGVFSDINIRDVVKQTQEAGINVTGNYIFGLPEETHQTMQETLQLSLELNTEYANFYCAMAYPGSPLHIIAKQEGKTLPKTYDGYSQHSYNCTPLAGANLTAAEILRFRDQAFDKYFTNPTYLKFMESKFGSVTRKNIEEMCKIKLRRKLLDEESYTLANCVVH